MRVKKLTNESESSIRVKCKNGLEHIVPPGVTLNDIDVVNEQDLKDKAKITFDLTEVNEEQGKTRLDD